MTAQDDIRRLSQLDSVFLGHSIYSTGGGLLFTAWYKGRVQQANDGGWIFRSISSDATVVGFQLGPATEQWSSSEAPGSGIVVAIPLIQTIAIPSGATVFINLGGVYVQQQLPQELTNNKRHRERSVRTRRWW
jgi:hypothetical protein